MPEYASHGTIGALTPQANTTVEPEFAILWPPGYAILNARITSPSATLMQRMRDYWPGTDSYLDQFGIAPLSAVAVTNRSLADQLLSELKGAEGESSTDAVEA